MSNIKKNNNVSIDFFKKIEQNQVQLQKQIDFLLKKIESQEKRIYEVIKERDEAKRVNEILIEKIYNLERDTNSIYQLSTRSFRFAKALAYSTGRFMSNSIFMEEPAEQIEYIREFELKDPETYPIGTYKARNGRLKNIVELVKEKGSITTQEIVRKFRICHHTARADMRDLLDAFPNALKLIIPKHRGRESYKLIEVSKLAWAILPKEDIC